MPPGLLGTIAMYSTVWLTDGKSAGHQAYYAAKVCSFITSLLLYKLDYKQ